MASKVTQEEAAEQARRIVEQAINEDKNKDPAEERRGTTHRSPTPRRRGKGFPKSKPAWIRYYEQEAKDEGSDFGKGCQKPTDYFDRMMEAYTDDEDTFRDLIQQNPESCALVFQEGNGPMKVFHHLTPRIHGRAIVLGVEGFGSASEVKTIVWKAFIKRTNVGSEKSNKRVPTIKEFLELDLDIIDTDAEGVHIQDIDLVKVHEMLDDQPRSYLIHPTWIFLIQDSIGKTPVEMCKRVVARVREACEGHEVGFANYKNVMDCYFDVYPFLVFLWACQQKIVSIPPKGITKSFEGGDYKDLQNEILHKVFCTVPTSQSREREETHQAPKGTTPGNGGDPAGIEPSAIRIRRERRSREAEEAEKRQPKRSRRSEPTRRRAFRSPSEPGDGSDSEPRSRSETPPIERFRRETDRERRGSRRGRSCSRPEGRGDPSPSRSRSPTDKRRPSRGERGRSRSNKSDERNSRSRSRNRDHKSRSPRRERDDRRGSRSPPRFDPMEAFRMADRLITKKGKSITDGLTPEQHKAFTLLAAEDWEDERPKLNSRMESILDQTRISVAVKMMRSTMKYEKWLGLIPESGVMQFLQNGILAESGSITPSGFSMFYTRPRTYDHREIDSEQTRKDRIAQAFGRDGITDGALNEMAKLEFYLPRTYQDLEVLIDTGIRWLDFCTRKGSIASQGLREPTTRIRQARGEGEEAPNL